MREYVIMTDSCCDLTDHMAKELGLTVVPLTVHIDGHDYPTWDSFSRPCAPFWPRARTS